MAEEHEIEVKKALLLLQKGCVGEPKFVGSPIPLLLSCRDCVSSKIIARIVTQNPSHEFTFSSRARVMSSV